MRLNETYDNGEHHEKHADRNDALRNGNRYRGRVGDLIEIDELNDHRNGEPNNRAAAGDERELADDVQEPANALGEDHQHHVHTDMRVPESDHRRTEKNTADHEKLHDLFGPYDRGMKEIAADDIRQINYASHQQAARRDKLGCSNNPSPCNQQMIQHECLR